MFIVIAVRRTTECISVAKPAHQLLCYTTTCYQEARQTQKPKSSLICPPVPEVFTEMSLTMRRGKRGYKLEGQNGVEREAGVGIYLQRLARTRVYGEAN
jgi:hypothetical protein